jgi:RNA polymerase sigma-70 factor (ECF subfamily)
MDAKEIEKLRNKNPKAISDLYDQYSPALYGVILRIIKSHSKAEAVLEHTFLKILEEIDTYNKMTTFFTWMCSIARSLAAESVTPNIPENGSPDEFIIESQLISKDYETLTEGMETDAREVLNLVYIEGHSLHETSRRLDMPLEKVKIQVKLAFGHINKVLQSEKKIFINMTLVVPFLIQF